MDDLFQCIALTRKSIGKMKRDDLEKRDKEIEEPDIIPQRMKVRIMANAVGRMIPYLKETDHLLSPPLGAKHYGTCHNHCPLHCYSV